MGEEKALVPAGLSVPGSKQVDSFFTKISGKIGGNASAFVAFLFIIVAIGIFIGHIVTIRTPTQIYTALLVPLILALIAYYNRAIATFLFVALLLFILLF